MAVSRQRSAKIKTPATIAPVKVARDGKIYYCRHCQKTKRVDDFFVASNHFLDKNGRMSICRTCCYEIFKNQYVMSGANIEVATLNTCRILDVKFSGDALNGAIKGIDMSNFDPLSFFGLYKAWVAKTFYGGGDRPPVDTSFIEPNNAVIADVYKNFETHHDVKEFWGERYSEPEYEFLERHFREWVENHEVQTKEQELLYKYLTQYQLDYEKERAKGNTGAALLKEQQKIMDMLDITPSKTKDNISGKSMTAFSDFIRMIEDTEPAEYYKDKKLFSDNDNIEQYITDFVTRPILNFFGQTPPDFYVENDGEGGHGGDLLREMQENEPESYEDDGE
jgi:hypothetical protein